MRKWLILFFVIFLMSQLGCVKSIRFTEEEIKNFPPNIQDNIRKGEIALGMTKEQVRYAWGSPDSIRILSPIDEKSREEWIYSYLGIFNTRILLFLDGKLIYIK